MVAASAVLVLVALVAACSAAASHESVDADGGRTAPTAEAVGFTASTTTTEAPTTTKAPKPLLYGGETDPAVLEMQKVLVFRGYDVPVDGTYGPQTVDAIKRYQTENGLPVDGVVGDTTWFALAFPHPTTTPPPTPPTTRPPAAPTQAAPAIPNGPVNHVIVRLSTQQLELYDGYILRAKFPVSSGANGATPRGTFRTFRKVPRATADSDPMVTMPWMTNFNDGIGFHGIPVRGTAPLPTPLGQYPVSHGCIRMADANAKWIFDNLAMGTRVDVV